MSLRVYKHRQPPVPFALTIGTSRQSSVPTRSCAQTRQAEMCAPLREQWPQVAQIRSMLD